jgi:hypothetical protein
MGIRNDAKEIAKLSALADNEQATPLVQIAAARKLLRFTNFSARSCRVGKRTANRWLAAEAVSQSVRNRAALLLNFTLERKLDASEEPEEATVSNASGSSPAPLVSPKRSILERNVGWLAQPVPRKFITYETPEDLIQFGIPALSAFAITSARGDWDGEIFAEDGTPYYVQFTGGTTARVLNPKYIPAYRSWKAKRFPGGLPDEFSDWYIRWLSWSDIQARPAWAERINQSWAVGSSLREQQYTSHEVELWEETFARELYFEIALRNRSNPKPYECAPWDIFHYHSQPAAVPEAVSPLLAATEKQSWVS